jgi:hypothetical protein
LADKIAEARQRMNDQKRAAFEAALDEENDHYFGYTLHF